jgi:hypothetical protein
VTALDEVNVAKLIIYPALKRIDERIVPDAE